MINESEVIIGHGKHIAYSDTEVGVYTNVNGTIEIQLPERELSASEYTNDDSPDFHKQYTPGVFEPGTIAVTYRYAKTGFTAVETIYQLACVAATRASATKWWKITLPDGSTGKVRGFIVKHDLPVEGDDSPVVEMEIQAIGKMVWTPAA